MNGPVFKNNECNTEILSSFARQAMEILRRRPAQSVLIGTWAQMRAPGDHMGCDLLPEPARPALKASRKPFKLRGLAGDIRCVAGPDPARPLIDIDPFSSTRIRFSQIRKCH
jgi:hypothetical protein